MVLLLSSRSFQTHVKAIGILKVVGALQQRGMLDQVSCKFLQHRMLWSLKTALF